MRTIEKLRSPYPWFGGKSRAADLIWSRLGDVTNYVEPFFGSGAVLLSRPHPARTETINDKDCYVANFWRSVKADPDGVAAYADWPVNEADLHARHRWLTDQADFRERMLGDPHHYDVKIAGWWVWGISQWIGGGWCSRGNGVVRSQYLDRRIPDLGGNSGATGKGVHRISLSRQLPQLGGDSGAVGRGILRAGVRHSLGDYISELCGRMRRVRVCCGDWKRVLGPSPTTCIGLTAVLLDPPYSHAAGRGAGIYSHDQAGLSEDVRIWAIEHGSDPRLRIALCGYEGEHEMPPEWSCVSWKANGGYGNQSSGRGRDNAARERIWFSPYCLDA